MTHMYGKNNFDMSELLKTGSAAKLPADLRDAVYKAGQKAGGKEVAREQAEVKSGKVKAKGTGGKVLFATGDGKYENLRDYEKENPHLLKHDRQKTGVLAAEMLSEALGTEYRFIESYLKVGEDGKPHRMYIDENGKEVSAPNGVYDNGVIYIDLNAGNKGEGTVLFTIAHELTHHIRMWSPAKFKILANYVVSQYGKHGVNVEALVAQQIDKAAAHDRTIDYDTALEEVVADSMQTILADGNVMQMVADIKKQDKSLAEKLVEWFKNLAKNLKAIVSAYSGSTPDSIEGRLVASMEKDVLKQIQQLYAEGLVEASENYQAAIAPGVEGTVYTADGDPIAHTTTDGTIQLSLRTYEEEGRSTFRKYLEKCVSSNKLTKEEMQAMMKDIEEIYTTCKDFKDKYAPFSSWSDAAVVRDTHGKPVFSVVTPNGDYKMNLDFSLVCKKRRTLDAVFNEMSKRGIIDDFELGQKSVVKINEIIRKHGLETACALCFVDAKRFRQASMADSFTNLYNELVLSLVPENQRDSIDHYNFSGYENVKKVEDGIHTWNNSKLDFSHLDEVMKTYGSGTVEYKAAKYIKTHPEGRRLLLRGDFMSSEGFDAVKTQNPDVLKLYNSKKGTGGPKAAFGDVQYMNEIVKKARTWTPAKAYAVGGVRIQSFSDYVPRMVFDYVQMVYDLAATKLPAHAYSKEALFVKQFGLTGIKINMSLIPAIAEGGIAPGLDANGNYVWAGESFDFETAKEIQNAEGYSENCGTICVGVSDRHIRKLLSDPDIRMVIPYHKSGLNPIVAHMNKIAEFTDYTNKQNTTVKETGGKAEKHFDFNEELHKMGENADPKAVIQKYFDWCDDNGYNPKFADFRDHPNYYKLIEDFTLYDKDGNYVPQREVRAVFPKEDSAFGSMKSLIEAGLEEDAIIEGKKNDSLSSIVDEIERTLPKTEAEIAEEQVEQADRDLEAVEKKYSLRDAKIPTREELNAKDPIKVVDISKPKTTGTFAKRREKILEMARDIISKPYLNSDTNTMIFLTEKSYTHAFNNIGDIQLNAAEHLPGFIENAVLTHAEPPEHGSDYTDAVYTFFAAAKAQCVLPVKLKVKEYRVSGQDLPKNIREYFDENPSEYASTYDTVVLEVEEIKEDTSGSAKDMDREDPFLSPNMSSDIKVADLLDLVKGDAEKYIPKPAIKLSDRDSDGNELSAQQQEFFADSKVRDKDGKLLKVYHGTTKSFTTFRQGTAEGWGRGIYFTDNRAAAEEFGENIVEAYLNITNPFNADTMSYKDIDAESTQAYREFDMQQWKRWGRDNGYDTYEEYKADGAGADVYDIYTEHVEVFNKILRELGYDGIIATDSNGIDGMEIVAFNENQPKLTTNTSPTADPDIRYSDRDGESVSNRALLANAFEGAVTNDIERAKLEEYKGAMDRMNAEEQKLQRLNAEIKELSFAKGARDTQRLEKLRAEAKKTANRINTYDKQLLRFEASKPLQNVLEREKAKAYERADRKGKKALQKQREVFDEKSKQMKRELTEKYQEQRKAAVDKARQTTKDRLTQKYQEQRENERERHDKTVMRNKIKGVVNELNQLLLDEDKKRHVPDHLKKAVADALALVNMDTVGAEERAAKYLELIEKETAKGAAADQDKIDAYTVTLENILSQGAKMGQRLKDLRDAYEEIQNSDDPDIANAYDPVIAGALNELASTIGDTSLRNMTIEQLSDVYDMYRMVLTKVRDANKSFLNDKKESISSLATRVVVEVKKAGGDHKYRAAILDSVKKFGWDNLKPVYAFERMGSATLIEAFNNVRAGEDVWATDVTEARDYFLEKSKKYKYDSWDMNKKYHFESASGIGFDLTLEQIMSLYAYSKREQAHEHLRLGGFVFDSNIETQQGKKGIIKYKVNTADAHQLTAQILGKITGTLSEDQKAFVDEMQKYLSADMGAKGNSVTMLMYGVKLFKEKFYFPLKSAKQFMFEQNEVAGEVKIKNSGFTNKTVAKANNPVILSNFMDVWANHVNEMSMYHAFTIPLEDFNRIFNYNSPKQEGQPAVSVKGTMQNAYSPAAVNYVKQLITDLNGGAVSDPRESTAKALMSKFKKAKVMASLSVVIQQPSAIARAFALVNPKYFSPTIGGKKHKELWNELKKYAPVAVIKEMGYFDTNMGMSTKDFITAKEYSGFGQKAKALFTDENYRDEVLSKAPALADELTWCAIWNAVKRETLSKNPTLKPTSEEFLKIAGERFTEVITKTQVYDSVLARSANMRSKSGMMNMVTSFMAEPTTAINMLEDAVLKAKRGDKKYAVKAFGSVATSIVLNNVLVALVYAARDDDEDETYAEKYAQAFVSGMIDDINPLTYYPFLKDMWSLLQGYDVERADMSLVSDIVDATKKLVTEYFKEDGDIAGAWWDMAGTVANLGGIPIQNIGREIKAAFNTYSTIMQDMSGRKTTKISMSDAVWDSVRSVLPVVGWVPGDTKGDKLYDAIISGDTAYADRLKGTYKDEDAATSAIRKALRNNDPRIHEAAELEIAGEYAESKELIKKIAAEGNFTENDIDVAVNAEVSKLSPNEEEDSAEKEKTTFDAKNYVSAIIGGGNKNIAAVHDDIIATKVANGQTEKEAEESLLSSAKSELKKRYVEKELTKQQVMNILSKHMGMDSDDVTELVNKWSMKVVLGIEYDSIKDQFIEGKVTESKAIEWRVRYGSEAQKDAAATVTKWKCEKETGIPYDEVKDEFLDGNITESKAIDMMIKYGGKKQKDAEQTVSEWKAEKETGVAYSKIKESFMDGEISESKAIDMYMEYGGKSQDEAEDSVAALKFEKDYGFSYSSKKQAYIDGEITESTLRKALSEYGEKDDEDVEDVVRAYNWLKQNPKYDLSESEAVSYTKPIEDYGISVCDAGIDPDTFVEYRERAGKCKGVDKNGDGKADTNTVKYEKLDVINSLPLTPKQKDALYFLNGWKASKLYQAPWH